MYGNIAFQINQSISSNLPIKNCCRCQGITLATSATWKSEDMCGRDITQFFKVLPIE
jgi:hypothetical protein